MRASTERDTGAEPCPTLVSCNFDGAAVMMGNRSGVATRIIDDFPWVTAIHCVAHKLELGVLDAVKTFDYLKKFEDCVKKIFLFYYYSPKRRRELKEIAEVLQEDLLQYGAVKSVRWVSSKSRALRAISRNLEATAAHTEHAASNARNADEMGKARDIHKTITTLRFVKFLHLLQDVLKVVVDVSLQFQSNKLLIIDIPRQVEKLTMQLKSLKLTPGKNMISFFKKIKPGFKYGESELQLNHGQTGKVSPTELPTSATYKDDEDVTKLIDRMVDYIGVRFQSSTQAPISHFSVMNFVVWPYDQDELITYGNTEIDELSKHFRQVLTEKEQEEIPYEWQTLKSVVSKMR